MLLDHQDDRVVADRDVDVPGDGAPEVAALGAGGQGGDLEPRRAGQGADADVGRALVLVVALLVLGVEPEEALRPPGAGSGFAGRCRCRRVSRSACSRRQRPCRPARCSCRSCRTARARRRGRTAATGRRGLGSRACRARGRWSRRGATPPAWASAWCPRGSAGSGPRTAS